jgi:opacity protein-like surface antigen
MKRQLIAAAAACAFAAPAMAAQGDNFIDGFYVPWYEADFGAGDDDGDGFGLKGAVKVGEPIYLTGEYQSVELDDTDLDVDELRLGVGLGDGAGARGAGLYGRLQYMDLDLDVDDDDGVVGHVGYALPVSPQLRLHGEAGYVLLSDVDGPELLAGATYQFAPNLAGFADFRASYLDVDNGGDLDLSQFRVGARFTF